MALPVLYSFRRCPYAMRARMAIAICGIRVEIREVVLRDKPPEMIAVSPKATVPVLLLPDGAVIDESLDIMYWALGLEDPEDWLACSNGEALILATETQFKPHLDRYKYASHYPGEDARQHRGQALLFVEKLDKILRDRNCICGNRRGLADVAIFPFIRQFANTDRDWFDRLDLAGLQGWLGRQLESSLFLSVMVKRKPWAAGDEPVIFPAG